MRAGGPILGVVSGVCVAVAASAVFWLGKNVFETYAVRDAEIHAARVVELTQTCETAVFRDWTLFCRKLDALPPEHFSFEKAAALAAKTRFGFPAESLSDLPVPVTLLEKVSEKFSAYRESGILFLLRKTPGGDVQGIAFSEERFFAQVGEVATKGLRHTENAKVRLVPVSVERGFGVVRGLPGAKVEVELARRERAESVAAKRAVVLAAAGIFVMLAAIVMLTLRVFSLSEKRYLFASAVSHELKTPLAELRSCTETALSRCRERAVRADLRAIGFGVREMNTVVENLLIFSRMKNGNLRILMTERSVEEIFTRLFERLGERLLAADADAVFDIAPDVRNRRLRTNVELLARILFNLADNAVKYAFRDGAENTVTFRVHAAGTKIAVDVEDEGGGIPEAFRERIFRPFERGAAGNETRGLGLGLTISAHAAKLLGGKLFLLRTSSAGTTFRLELETAN